MGGVLDVSSEWDMSSLMLSLAEAESVEVLLECSGDWVLESANWFCEGGEDVGADGGDLLACVMMGGVLDVGSEWDVEMEGTIVTDDEGGIAGEFK